MVPLDICRAIADACSPLGMSTVLWPAILYCDGDVGSDIFVPTNVYDFDMVVED